MNLSDNGARLIEEFEGFRSKPYRDAVGVWTIGYGSTRGVGPSSPVVTKQQAHDRLKREVTETYGASVNGLGLALNQNQFDALCSFTYNCGPGAIGPKTTVGRNLRARNWTGAAGGLLAWNKGGGRVLAGLTRRREAERKLFLTPGQPGQPAKPQPVVKGVPGKIPQLNYVIGPGMNQRVPAVKVLQNQLKSHGHPNLNVDAVYGPETQAVVEQFQKNHGLGVDGIVGAETWKKVFSQ